MPYPSPSRFLRSASLGLCLVLAACGGSNDPRVVDPGTPPVTPGATAPSIARQPADTTVAAGQSATFSVEAGGTAPLAYQWQRDGSDIAGANGTGYTTPALTPADSGASFGVVVSNSAGSATSKRATLTVTPAATAPVLGITTQPASISVVAGASASFTVAATCSAGSLTVQWQRSGGSGFADIAGATTPGLALTTALSDNGAQFRAKLSCSGQSAAQSDTATLGVSAPASLSLNALNLTGTRTQARIHNVFGVDQEAAGSYVFNSDHQIMRLSADLQTVTVVAGSTAGAADGAANNAMFRDPRGIAHDASGNVWVTEALNQTIRRIAPDGTVTTVAGAFGVAGTDDGTGSAARFNFPNGIALGPDGDFYVTEFNSNRIRRVTPQGVVTTYAGDGTLGYVDGAPGTARFNKPNGIAVAANGDVYVADTFNNRIRRIVRSGTQAGNVVTLAGINATGSGNPPQDGPAGFAEIPLPNGLLLRGSQLYVLDAFGLMRVINTATGTTTTLTGSRSLGSGVANGAPETQARLTSGTITAAPNGGFLVTEANGLALVDASGNVHTVADTNATHQSTAFADGGGVLSSMPLDLATVGFVSLGVDSQHRVIVAENVTGTVKRIESTGALTLLAGQVGQSTSTQWGNGTGEAAVLGDIGRALAVAPDDTVYIADQFGVRRIGTGNAVTTLAGSRTLSGGVDGTASAARFGRIAGLAVGPNGDLFAGDTQNCAIRRIDAAGNTSTFAGVIGHCASTDGPLATARFSAPAAMAFAADGTLYVSDAGQLRRIAPNGTVSTIAGVTNVAGIAVGPAGTVYAMVSNAADIGLYAVDPASGARTLLLPGNLGGTVVTGSTNPNLGPVTGSIALLGAQQIVAVVDGQLVVATLP